MKLELSYIQKHNNGRRVATERERESTLTAVHRCHGPRIPFGHVLIERICARKHCKREGATKKEKDQPTTNHKKGTVSKPQKQK